MRFVTTMVVGLPLVVLALVADPKEAAACGGCFVPPEENTQVTGHRMIFSVGQKQSTLYDQIEYAGDPAEFAWVLPIRGVVEIGVSSDLIFNQLGFDTAVEVLRPWQNCPEYSCPGAANSVAAASGGGGGAFDGGGVDVLAEEVVGPYETVQLASSDPEALATWLASHGYNIPSDIQPVIAGYVADGFNFLAMRLVPGVGTERMQPVRITTPGSNAVLPLKMVAAGTGATTTLTLYLVGEGRYAPVNFPSFTIPAMSVVWDYGVADSNYTLLRAQAYAASNGYAWLVEAALPYSPDAFRAQITNVIDFAGPEQAGYGGPKTTWEEAHALANEDLDVLFAGMDPTSVMVTRTRAELSRAALGSDLIVGASADQSEVSRTIQTTRWVGVQPTCAPRPECDNPIVTNPGATLEDDGPVVVEGGCSVGETSPTRAALGVGSFLALLFLIRRARRRSR
jgi:hypothetical protein